MKELDSLGNPSKSGDMPFSNLVELNCFFKDDQLVYQSVHSNDFGDCIVGIDNTLINKSQPIVYPNPVYDISILKIPNHDKYFLEIFDVLGRRKLCKEIRDDFQIRKTDFRQGIYVFRLLKNNQFYSSGKFVVK